MIKHNHITLDIKPMGVCRACDEFYNSRETSEQAPTAAEFRNMREALERIAQDLRNALGVVEHSLKRFPKERGE